MILPILHICFLGAFFIGENSNLDKFLFASILVMVCFSYRKLSIDSFKYYKSDLYSSFFLFSGAITTFYLNFNLSLGPVISAGIIGTLASFIPNLNKTSENFKKIPAKIYCGSFIGMTSYQVAGGYWFILTASIISGLIYIYTKNYLNGFGGKLGTISFGGVFISSLLILII